MGILIDTSILVAVERDMIDIETVAHETDGYSISVVTAAELLHGVHRASGKRARARSAYVESLLARFDPIPISVPIARAYAAASAELARRGTPVDPNDLWIGATAIAENLRVVAMDGDFDRIPGVKRVSLT